MRYAYSAPDFGTRQPNSAKHNAPGDQIEHEKSLIKIPLFLPSSEITPQTVQTVRHAPILPEYFNAACGEMKIPLPIITLRITLTAARSPKFL
jgi:hypothetical protein